MKGILTGEGMNEAIERISGLVWGMPTVALIICVSIYFTIKIRFFQVLHLPTLFKRTFLTLFKREEAQDRKGSGGFSRLRTVSTSLAATIGTGSITGVAAALSVGGPGAIFWMWVSAFLGMAAAYAEGVLSVKYRKRLANGEYKGGAMYYIEMGLGKKRLAKLYAFLCVLTSFGMGNMAQSNAVSETAQNVFSLSPALTGAVIFAAVWFIASGGASRAGKAAEITVPIVAVLFLICSLAVLIINRHEVLNCFAEIVGSAFGLKQAAGGFLGYGIKEAVSTGFKRGIFSNEAGLGTTASVHAKTEVRDPSVQGLWGMFEVFADTMVISTLTALVILSSGALQAGGDAAKIVSEAFSSGLGKASGAVISVSIIMFAFATIIGWSCIGESAFEYLFGEKTKCVYHAAFALCALSGALLSLETVWNISDIFNGLMVFPNLLGIVLLSGNIKPPPKG